METRPYALEMPFANGTIIAKEVTEWLPDKPVREHVLEFRIAYWENDSPTVLASLRDLGKLAAKKGVDLRTVVDFQIDDFQSLILLITQRHEHRLVRAFMNPVLEGHFNIPAFANRPRVEGDCFIFLCFTSLTPNIHLCELTINLDTMKVTERELIDAPWPGVNDDR
jgi:hypothetical protein